MWTVVVTYVIVSYVISLRRNEVFLLDLEELNENWKINNKNYFIIALLWKIKGENVDERHLTPCINHTDSGINIKAVARYLKEAKIDAAFTYWPEISDINDYLYSSAEMHTLMSNPS